MSDETTTPHLPQPVEQPPQQPPQGGPLSVNVELPMDLIMGAAQFLQRPPEAVGQVIVTVIGQMVMRGLGVRVGPPPRQDGILVARGMPPPPPAPGPRLVRP